MNFGKTFLLKNLVWDRPGLVLDLVFLNECSPACLGDEHLANSTWQAKQHIYWDTKNRLHTMLNSVVRNGEEK